MDFKKLSDDIAIWIYEYVKNAGAEGVVVGVSGGIDSAVVLGLAKKAFPDNTFGVIMPCGNVREDELFAQKLLEKFEVPYKKVDFTEMFHGFLASIGAESIDANLSQLSKTREKLALANSKSRMRMIILYYFAQVKNYLVLGTGNRTEEEIGYFTKYGDGGVDLLPIAGLFKSEVRKLGQELGVIDEILNRVPSGGLWAGQTDEGEIGLSYDEMEFGIRKYYKLPENEELKIVKDEKEILTRIEKLIKANLHKRVTPPIYEIKR